MKPKQFITTTIVILCVFTMISTMAQETSSTTAPVIIPVWPEGKMPGQGAKEPEKEQPSRGDNVCRITNISNPTLSVFQAPKSTQITPAVIICPGGAYQLVGYDKEGTEIAAWFNSIGITGVVLKYRVPNNMEGAFQDIQRAIRTVRHNAAAWNIDPKRVGVMGFSAGGHLSARLSNNFEKSTYPKIDEMDELNLRPDFTILMYPAYLRQGEKLAKEFSIPAQTPPTFMVHTEDDKMFIAGTKLYNAALNEAKIPNEFFFCETGGHGYGLRAKGEVSAWPKKCQEWLTKAGVLP